MLDLLNFLSHAICLMSWRGATDCLTETAPLPGMNPDIITPPSCSCFPAQPVPLSPDASCFLSLSQISHCTDGCNRHVVKWSPIHCRSANSNEERELSSGMDQFSALKWNEKVKLFHTLSEVKWRSDKSWWIRKNFAVPSVWIYWRSQWLFPAGTATVWAVLRGTGMKKIRRKPTAVLSADRPLLWSLSWGKTPCWQI